MTSRQTSLAAFDAIKESLGERQFVVLRLLRRRGAMNNRMVADELGWPINTVTPRMNELVKKGLVVPDHVGFCPVTGRKTEFWRSWRGE